MHADVLIITATDVESDAVLQVWEEATQSKAEPVHVRSNFYQNLGAVNGTRVCMIQSEMGAGGLGAAQQTIDKGITALSPSAVIMVGIAFGVKHETQNIGDILVSQKLMMYDPQRVGLHKGRRKVTPRGPRADASASLLNYFHSAKHYWKGQAVHFGLVLSGETLVDNIAYRQKLLALEPEAIGGEMEGAGLYVACQYHQVHWILVKAICDWADGHKAQDKDEHQRLAASNAANFVLHALQHAPFKLEKKRRKATPAKSEKANGKLTEVRWSERNKEAVEYFVEICDECSEDEDRLIRTLTSWDLVGLTQNGLNFTIEGALLFGPNDRPPLGYNTDIQIDDSRFAAPRIKSLNGHCLLSIIKELRGYLSELWQGQWEDPSRRDESGRPLKIARYPETAVIEAMVNFVIHRDYSINDLAVIVIADDHVEFINPGTSFYSPEELLSARKPLRPKYRRNSQIIKVMSRTRLNQRQGGGVIRIREALERNRNFRKDGNLGLEINIDEQLKRFSLLMYQAEPPSATTTNTGESSRSNLPHQPYFFGREEELKKIGDALLPDLRSWGVLIDGPGGIGKTALAVRAAHLAPAEHFPLKIFLSAKVRELNPAGEQKLQDFMLPNFIALITELAAELGEQGVERTPPSERANIARRALADEKALIVIDNIETFDEPERVRLYQFLSRLPSACKAIVTSRRRTDIDARVIRLDRLAFNEALDLIAELSKSNRHLARADRKECQDLYEISGGNPLLIKWMAGQLGRPGSNCRTISEAYDFIASAPKDNDPLEYIFGDLLDTFTKSEMAVLAALTHFTLPAKVEWIAELSGLSLPAAQTALEDLADRALLLSDDMTRTFLLPPLAATFLRRKRPVAVAHTGPHLTARVYALAIENGYKNYERFPKLEAEWPLIAAALPLFLQGGNDRIQKLCNALDYFLDFSGRWDEQLSLNRQAEERALAAGDYFNAGWRAYQAGWTYYLQGQAAEVLLCAARSHAHWQKANAGEEARATAISLRGTGYEIQKNYPAAIAAYQEALELYRTGGPENNSVVSILNDLAGLKKQSGDYSAAEYDYREALRIAKKINDQERVAMCTGNLAELSLDRRDWLAGEELAREALALAEAVGRVELIGSNCHRLAKALSQQGRQREGLPYARRSVEIFTKLRQLEKLKVAEAVLKECEKDS